MNFNSTMVTTEDYEINDFKRNHMKMVYKKKHKHTISTDIEKLNYIILCSHDFCIGLLILIFLKMYV